MEQFLATHLDSQIQFFATLLAVMNPIGAVPLFLAFTDSVKPQRSAIARVVAISCLAVLVVCLIAGQIILNFFGISIDSFRIAGGLLLLIMALNMLHARRGRTRHSDEEDEEAMESDSVGVVPLAIPLIAGPGTMSSAILFSSHLHGLLSYVMAGCVCILICGIIWGVLAMSKYISMHLGHSGMNVMTRIMGLLLAAMAIEIMLGGLKSSFGFA